ncbi:MAG: hypothetical protein ACLTBV_21540 [Enterocloster bolteae]
MPDNGCQGQGEGHETGICPFVRALIHCVRGSDRAVLAGLKDAYVASKSGFRRWKRRLRTTRYSDAFASDLCVVTDEASYDPRFCHIGGSSAFDMDDREVLYSKDVFERMYPASITKIMTALVAIKEGDLKIPCPCDG